MKLGVLVMILVICLHCWITTAQIETYYDTLHITDLNASFDEIRASYRQLAKKYHPDRQTQRNTPNDDTPQDFEAIFLSINQAYEILSDPVKRRRYDYLLSEKVYIYEDQDWAEFDRRRSGPYSVEKIHNWNDPSRPLFIFRDAIQSHRERMDTYMLIGLAIGVLVFAGLPAYYVYSSMTPKKRSSTSKSKSGPAIDPVDVSAVKKAQELQKAHDLALKREREEEKEYMRALNQRTAALRAQQTAAAAEASRDDDDHDDDGKDENDIDQDRHDMHRGDDHQDHHDVLSSQNDDHRETSSQFDCKVCRKSYKTQAMLSQHLISKAHIKKAKQR